MQNWKKKWRTKCTVCPWFTGDNTHLHRFLSVLPMPCLQIPHYHYLDIKLQSCLSWLPPLEEVKPSSPLYMKSCIWLTCLWKFQSSSKEGNQRLPPPESPAPAGYMAVLDKVLPALNTSSLLREVKPHHTHVGKDSICCLPEAILSLASSTNCKIQLLLWLAHCMQGAMQPHFGCGEATQLCSPEIHLCFWHPDHNRWEWDFPG